ncbi:MAG TPA: hypothetical protein VK112_06135 [Fodinibius sp.]|nr:hypothetical protein [Fodinibius sp.]
MIKTQHMGAVVLMIFVLGFFAIDGLAQEATTVVVRAKAKDAKFVGTSMGGAHILIRNAATGQILTEGVTEGSTGDTGKLMRTPRERYADISTPDAAKFKATLTLEEPVFVTVSATAPGVQRQSKAKVSTQLWLIPGKDILGDGIILEIPGFAIDILQPQAHEATEENSITITANAVMMCGCPISPGGLWDSNEMEFTAVISQEGQKIARKEMAFAGKSSTFEVDFSPEESGVYEVTVYGFDPRTGNAGVDKTSFIKR